MKKDVSSLVKINMKPYTLFISFENIPSFRPFGNSESRKPKVGSKVLRKLYYIKIITSR